MLEVLDPVFPIIGFRQGSINEGTPTTPQELNPHRRRRKLSTGDSRDRVIYLLDKVAHEGTMLREYFD